MNLSRKISLCDSHYAGRRESLLTSERSCSTTYIWATFF